MEDLQAVSQSSGRRAAAYWFSDGLPEVAFGSAMTLLGGLGFAWVVWLPYRWMGVAFVLTAGWFFALYIWDRKILDAIKARLTYPRTGYAQPPADGHPEGQYIVTLNTAINPSPKRNVTAFRMSTVDMFIVGTMLTEVLRAPWSIAVMMPAVASLIYWGHRWSEYPYSWWSALLLGLSGIPFYCMRLPLRAEAVLPILLGGVWLFCRGAWRLIQYLRHNPRRIEVAASV
jgi:hypothetical protein